MFVAVYGSAWANTVYLPARSVAIQLFGYGVLAGCGDGMNM